MRLQDEKPAYAVLQALRCQSGIEQDAIAQLVGRTPEFVSEILDMLERHGKCYKATDGWRKSIQKRGTNPKKQLGFRW